MYEMFNSFSRFNDRVLGGLDDGDRSAKKFKYLLGLINQTLIDTHRLVIGRLTALADVTTAGEADELIEQLRWRELEESFRVEGMCDALQSLGDGLVGRAEMAEHEGYFSAQELAGIKGFGQMLQNREAEVARIYSDALVGIVRQRPVAANSLSKLKNDSARIKVVLTAQVGDFTVKSARFMRVGTN